MYELLITEKPQAAAKIAAALANGKPIKESNQGVPYYKITHGSNDIVVACAVGHLYGLAQDKDKKKWSFPVFDIGWAPAHESRKEAGFSKKYLMTLKKLAKDASSYTVATDYDVEGEVIGLNVVRYACKQKDANRMKFSTLTKDDLVEAYENKSKTLDWGQANAGETRHFLDWFNGINFSRALTSSIKAAGSFKLMSTGRVQGPALKIIVDREKEIKAFKPVPYWQIQMITDMKGGDVEAWHKEEKFWEKDKADSAMNAVKGAKTGTVSDKKTRSFQQAPPTPFDLTTLQTESYRCFGIQPKDTLAIAQDLYTSGFISYPRTSSQQLDPKIGFAKIMKLLSKQKEYAPLVDKLGKGKLTPNNGKKTDPAHPAIYPTGVAPHLDSRMAKVYDLVVRRFLATFGTAAKRETMNLMLDVNKEPFLAKGTRTVEKGWHDYYGPYVKLEELELPSMDVGDSFDIKKIDQLSKETEPPRRYTPASIIKELEKRNLGTKATRASIVETLFQRGYVLGKSIEATELGIRTFEALEKYVPKIVDEELTKQFEDDMELIREGKKTEEEILEKAKGGIIKILEDFKKSEKKIGEELLSANRETRDKMTTLGPCPKCKEGAIQIRKGKYGMFAACNKYPDCKTTYSLPRGIKVVPADKVCEVCSTPMIRKILAKKAPQDFCLNPNCESKKESLDKEALAIESGELEKPCPKCDDGKLVLRSSIYGKFLGCSNYPKCKHIEKMESKEGDPKQTNKKEE